jgi:membrane-associated protease RseP (regulator of RpoE activity)
MGHYLTAKKFRVKTTPPFFLPAPNIFGTFGAIIFLKGRTPSRASLLYVGGMGPFLGFLVAIPVYLIGLSLSYVGPTSQGNLSLGDSLITLLLGHLMYPDIPEGYTIHLHPVGYAGWVGFFLTGLNMLPLGQLDGGHVVYSLSPRLFYFSSRLSMAFLIILSQFIWQFWLGLIILLLFFAFHHPSPEVWENPLPWKSRLFALLCLLIGIVTFVPKPLILS